MFVEPGSAATHPAVPAGIGPVFTPLPHVPSHIMQAIAIGRERPDGAGSGVTIGGVFAIPGTIGGIRPIGVTTRFSGSRIRPSSALREGASSGVEGFGWRAGYGVGVAPPEDSRLSRSGAGFTSRYILVARTVAKYSFVQQKILKCLMKLVRRLQMGNMAYPGNFHEFRTWNLGCGFLRQLGHVSQVTP